MPLKVLNEIQAPRARHQTSTKLGMLWHDFTVKEPETAPKYEARLRSWILSYEMARVYGFSDQAVTDSIISGFNSGLGSLEDALKYPADELAHESVGRITDLVIRSTQRIRELGKERNDRALLKETAMLDLLFWKLYGDWRDFDEVFFEDFMENPTGFFKYFDFWMRARDLSEPRRQSSPE